jgi:predicted RND superfamily exporter protein
MQTEHTLQNGKLCTYFIEGDLRLSMEELIDHVPAVTDYAEIEVLTQSITIAMGVTLSAVVGVTFLMPGVHLRNAVVLSCVMFLCCVEIIGFIALTGIKFWSQTLVQVVIAIGLAVDYSIQ